MTVREAAFQLFRDLGFDRVFGNPGSTELPMFRDFPRDFSYVLGLNEAVVVAMADGFAQASGRPALVNLHSAAGVGHAMGSIFSAYRNGTPLIITAGQQARSMLPFDPYLSSAEASELPKPYVKWSCEPARAQDVPQMLARAFYMAMQPPQGPVLVSVPVDDWAVLTRPVRARPYDFDVRASKRAMHEVASALQESRQPVFVVGSSVDKEGAWQAMVELAERHQARVWVAPASSRCCFPENHPLFGGFLPRNRAGIVEALQGSDLLVVIGAPLFTYHVEGCGPHVPEGAKVFHISDDPSACARSPVGTSILSSIKAAVADLLELSQARQSAPMTASRLPERRAVNDLESLDVDTLLHVLSATRPANSVIVEEAPSSREKIQQHLPCVQPGSFFTASSGSLGYSLPASIGVAMAQPDKRVIALIGDGSSMYAIQAIWSAVEHQLPITFVIVNNRGYSALKKFAAVFDMEEALACDLKGLDFVTLAAGQGCVGERVADAGSFRQALETAFSGDRPRLIEVLVS
ncbi:MAG: benzoylformate decarboxylase [Pigmentiphaga sp.]|nr:benzoylformate decarboxylase [Pigmentiphaga sp.]